MKLRMTVLIQGCALLLSGFIFGYLVAKKPVTVRWRWDTENFDTMTLHPGACVELSRSGIEGYEMTNCSPAPAASKPEATKEP